MSYNHPREDRATQLARSVKSSSSSTSSSPTRSPKVEHEIPRAAGQHHFIVANMFGPIDWALDAVFDKPIEQPSKQKKRVLEAKMFGPTDWIAESELFLDQRDSGVAVDSTA